MANQKKRRANPFFDLTIGSQTGARVITTSRKRGGRIVMELYAETTPKTAGNFRALRTGMKGTGKVGEKGTGKVGKPLHYKEKNLPKNRKKKKAANRKVFVEGLNLNKTVEGSVPADPAPAGPAGSSSGRNKTVEGSVPAVPAPAGPAGSSSGRNKTVEGSVPPVPKNKKKKVASHVVFFEGLDLNKTVEGSVPAPAGPQSMSSVNCNLGL